MPGLTFSNELISRDEALHTEFAVLLHSKLERPLKKQKIEEIIREAVDIEIDFMLLSIIKNFFSCQFTPFQNQIF